MDITCKKYYFFQRIKFMNNLKFQRKTGQFLNKILNKLKNFNKKQINTLNILKNNKIKKSVFKNLKILYWND